MDGNKKVRRIARIAIFSCLLFAQEEALTFLPNIQFTQLLITVYFFAFGYLDTIIITSIHVLLDNLVMGSFSLLYTPAMFIGWLILPTILLLIRNKDNRLLTAFVVMIHSFIYSWLYLIPSVFLYKVPFKTYFIADIPFEILLALTGFITVFFFKNKLVEVLNKLKK